MRIFNFFSIYQDTSFSRFPRLCNFTGIKFTWRRLSRSILDLANELRQFQPTSCAIFKDFAKSPRYLTYLKATTGNRFRWLQFDTSSHAVYAVLFKPSPLPHHRGSISNQLITLHVCVTTTVPLFVWKQTQPSTRRDAQAVKFDVGISALEPRQLIKVFLLYQGFFEISSTFSFLYVWKDKRKLLINKLLFKDWKSY